MATSERREPVKLMSPDEARQLREAAEAPAYESLRKRVYEAQQKGVGRVALAAGDHLVAGRVADDLVALGWYALALGDALTWAEVEKQG